MDVGTMKRRKAVRWALTLASVIILPIIYLNIENLAVRLGIDTVVADAISPRQGSSPLLEFALHPATFAAAAFILGIMAGIWIDTFLARRERAVELPAAKEPLDLSIKRGAIIDSLAMAMAEVRQLAMDGMKIRPYELATREEFDTAKRRAGVLIARISFDEAVSRAASNFLKECDRLYRKSEGGQDAAELRQRVKDMTGPLFKMLHEGSAASRDAIPAPLSPPSTLSGTQQ